MRVAVLGPSEDACGHSTLKILQEAKKVFKKAELIPVAGIKLSINDGMDAFHGKKSLKRYDYIIPRIDSKRAQIGYPVIYFLDDMGVRKPYPASTVLMAHNKFMTLVEIAKRGVPVPETWITGSKKAAGEIIDKQKLPVIMKLLGGFGGQGVMMMESKNAAKAALGAMKTLRQEVLLEEYLPNPGEDVRAIVAGEDVIASFKRVARSGEKKANIHLGGKGTAFKLTPEMEDIALESAKAIKAKICAIDMLVSKGKVYVIEANINPGLKGIEQATDINVAQRIVDYVKGELKR